MRKFLAVVKHEYRKIVIKWTFLIGTLLFPLLAIGIAVVPALIFTLKGQPMRIVIVDPGQQVAQRLKSNLSGEGLEERMRRKVAESQLQIMPSQDQNMARGMEQLTAGFHLIDYDALGKTGDEIRQDLNAKAANDEIDGYLLVPVNVSDPGARFEFRSRKAGDFVANDTLRDALNAAVRSERLTAANIDESLVEGLSRNIHLQTRSINEAGEEKDSDMLFIASLVIGMMIYITLTIYGQVIMGAVVEEKETRIAEILFSSATPFELMFGKLVGVGLAGLTQLGIWVASIGAMIVLIGSQANGSEFIRTLPEITPVMLVYFFIFFLLGYFIYASMFALVGSMVTSVQEGGQFAFPPIMIMLIGFYFCFAVVRDPNSDLSFWVSIAPLFAPMTMPVRILAEMPPFWQIALSMAVNLIAIAGLVWLAGRVYRIGMLMYGKRATIPEVLKWIRQG